MTNKNLISEPWTDYELLDSGDNKKLERYGKIKIIRPETQAVWKPMKPEEWKKADGEFIFEEGRGRWIGKLPEEWQMTWEDLKFKLRPTSFKHIGVFPEQAENWKWIKEKVSALETPKVLNLFGYTGIASAAALKAGAHVTHVDASRQTNLWAKENAALSGIPEEKMRFICDDALKFAEREVRRGSVYEGIILDPPAFGRGAKGEVWKIEESIQELLLTLSKLLSKNPGAFLLLNGYASGYSPESFLQAAESYFGKIQNGEFGELQIQEADSGRVVPSGIYVRFSR